MGVERPTCIWITGVSAMSKVRCLIRHVYTSQPFLLLTNDTPQIALDRTSHPRIKAPSFRTTEQHPGGFTPIGKAYKNLKPLEGPRLLLIFGEQRM